MTTENKHTPGPWKINYETEELQTDTYVLGHIYGCSHEDSPDCIANANLIAAAPDMLEALKEAYNFILIDQRDKGNEKWFINNSRLGLKIKAAILKAQGE